MLYAYIQGDSGGPLICRGADDNRWHLLGITSFGPAGHCAQLRPAVFARVTHFNEWMNDHINGVDAIDGNIVTKNKTDYK